ncbi:hypothetical protein Lepto7375DRAFT_0164 [Leptolyngbya sp. PCC 7375]|nr:hypothetical protein Lepto7375DRAFT_0164 [Leptolyngbya sp. PCC 7375]
MYKILTVSLVFAIAVGCNNFPSDRKEAAAPASLTTAPVEIRPSPGPTASVPELEVTISPAQSETLYISEQFRFQFNTPTGYVIDSTETSTSEHISILRQEDVGTLEPPLIYISVQENPNQLSLATFRDQEIMPLMETEHPNTTVAGQPALDFESTGLYAMRNLLFSTPDGRYIIHLNASYSESPPEADPL